MNERTVFSGNLVAEGKRIGIVAARFNEFITSRLVDGAFDALSRHGVKENDVDIAWCHHLPIWR